MTTVSSVLYGYSALLISGGAFGFVTSGFQKKALSSIIVGGSTGLISLICGVLSRRGEKRPEKGEKGYVAYQAGVHLGILLPALLTPMFAWRAWKASENPEKMYLARILSVLSIGSLITLGLLFRLKPKPKKRE